MRPATSDEVCAAAAARQELGGEYDGAVLESLVARLDGARATTAARPRGGGHVVIALGSIGFGVLFAAAAGGLGPTGGTVATLAAWLAIAVVNVAHGRAR